MPKIPLAHWVDASVSWAEHSLGPLFSVIAGVVTAAVNGLDGFLQMLPWWLVMIVAVGIGWAAAGWQKGWKLALGSAIGLLLVFNLGLWSDFLLTLSLVLIATLLSLLVGIPLGIWSAANARVHAAIFPILDFMQTMPSFVYLLPAMAFFGIGVMPAVFATVIFAMPPAIRLTDLGIRQVPGGLIEAGEAFGASRGQMLTKVQLPLALPTMMAGVNQTIMLSLSMVVIASLIGAGGLGDGVNRALGQLNTGSGFEYGVSVVVLAMILDRLTATFAKRGTPGRTA